MKALKPTLADHQTKGETAAFKFFREGGKRLLMVAPTGAGKTVLFGSIADKLAEQNRYVLILTDRENLLEQTGKSVNGFFQHPISYIKAGGEPPQMVTLEGQKVHIFVAMVESLNNRLNESFFQSFIKRVTMVIIDEAHERRFSKIINNELFKYCNFLGVTATPIYSSKRHLMRDDYEEIKVLATEGELIEKGLLVEPKTISFKVDKDGMSKKNGEYTDESQIHKQKEVMPLSRMVDIYKTQCSEFLEHIKKINPILYATKYANSRYLKSIFFGVNSAHVLEITEALNFAGIPAKFILSDTKIQSRKDRAQTEKDFKNNAFKVLVNCQITTKGYDAPDVIVIGKMYKTASIAKDNQVGGRGSRTMVPDLHLIETAEEKKAAIAESRKPYFIILDYLGNYSEHGRWQDTKEWKDIFYAEKKKEKNGEAPTKECPKCKNMVLAGLVICNALITDPKTNEVKPCGHRFESKVKELKEVEFIEIDEKTAAFQKLSDYEIQSLTVEEIVAAYQNKNLNFKRATAATRRKGNEFLITFARLNNYKDPKKWIEKRFPFLANTPDWFSQLQKKELNHLKNRLKNDLEIHYQSHPFMAATIQKIRLEAAELLKSCDWFKMNEIIRAKYLV